MDLTYLMMPCACNNFLWVWEEGHISDPNWYPQVQPVIFYLPTKTPQTLMKHHDDHDDHPALQFMLTNVPCLLKVSTWSALTFLAVKTAFSGLSRSQTFSGFSFPPVATRVRWDLFCRIRHTPLPALISTWPQTNQHNTVKPHNIYKIKTEMPSAVSNSVNFTIKVQHTYCVCAPLLPDL